MKQRHAKPRKSGPKTSARVVVAVPAITDLPPRDTKHWLSQHKAIVVAAVRSGVLSLYDAHKRYALSVEELLAWEHAMAQCGSAGLDAAHAQQLRRPKR